MSVETSRHGVQLELSRARLVQLAQHLVFPNRSVAITPMVDLFLLASLPFGVWSAVLPFVITFLAMDVLLATLACILEREPILRAWRIFRCA